MGRLGAESAVDHLRVGSRSRDHVCQLLGVVRLAHRSSASDLLPAAAGRGLRLSHWTLGALLSFVGNVLHQTLTEQRERVRIKKSWQQFMSKDDSVLMEIKPIVAKAMRMPTDC